MPCMKGRSVRCVGDTSTGKRCKRRTTNANGICGRHGSPAVVRRVSVRKAEDGSALLLIPGHSAQDLIYLNPKRATQVAREYLMSMGGGELVIEGSDGEVVGEESIPSPEWWIEVQ